jgi:pimeloyl-ACP methyl ester carboxylesterase
MILGIGDEFIETMIKTWGGKTTENQARLDAGMEVYKRYFREKSVVYASCADYRAGALIDARQDDEDQREGRKIKVPTLVLYSEKYLGSRYDVEAVWSEWVGSKESLKVRGIGNEAGHFIVEEQPEEVTEYVVKWLKEDLGLGLH